MLNFISLVVLIETPQPSLTDGDGPARPLPLLVPSRLTPPAPVLHVNELHQNFMSFLRLVCKLCLTRLASV